MNFTVGEISHVLLAIIGVAMAFTLVSSANTSSIISAAGQTFSTSLKAAMGH